MQRGRVRARRPRRARTTPDAPPPANHAYTPATRTTDHAAGTHTRDRARRQHPSLASRRSSVIIIIDLLTQTPAAAISRKSPAQEVILSTPPDRTRPPTPDQKPPDRPTIPGFCDSLMDAVFSTTLRRIGPTVAVARQAVVRFSRLRGFARQPPWKGEAAMRREERVPPLPWLRGLQSCSPLR